LAGSAERIPRLVPRANPGDMRSLPLTPVDGFVLSRVDGKLSARDLAASTGLSDDQVSASLDKLAELKVVAFGPTAGPSAEPSVRPRAVSQTSEASGSTPPPMRPRAPSQSFETRPSSPAPAPAEAEAKPVAYYPVADDAPELQEQVDIELDVKRRILGIYPRLGTLDHYELLNVERTADKKIIKRAYFEFAAIFHPDKYFRKELGTFKLKMENLFGRATQAYEVLTSKGARDEYDQYLADVERTRGLDSMLQSALQEMEAAEAQAASGPLPAPPSPTWSSAPAASPLSPPPTTVPPPSAAPPSAAQVAATERARREALAARLMGGRPTGPPRAPATPSPEPKTDPGSALKRLHDDRIAAARRAQLNKYLAMAAESERKNDVVGMAHAYKVVLTLVGDDAALRQKVETAIQGAEVLLAETYQRQAIYEERSESWADAARSWTRVAKARPHDSRAHERAANSLMRSGGDLHDAAELALRAIAMEPSNPGYKVTLANVYLAAGLTRNARRELEAAAQLSPGDGTIAALLKRVQKAG
jgi:curved DNA-binding protein CbpA